MRKCKISIIFLCVVVGLCYMLYNFYSRVLSYESEANVKIIIKPYTRTYAIASMLEERELIKNRYFFYIVARYLQIMHGKKLQAGEYKFEGNLTQPEVLDKIVNGRVFIRKLTVPEGYTISQINFLMGAAEGIKKSNDAIKVAEGSLLPGTYLYTYATESDIMVEKMSLEMEKFLEEGWEGCSAFSRLLLGTKENALILASIVERETGLDSERTLIARVYLNRLAKSMPLQADPTVIYGITGGSGAFDRRLTFNDLKYDSPYNTYITRKLPPTPICNPGRASILATMHPAESDALYFVADGSGGHVFSKTFDEHKASIREIRNRD